MSAPAPPPVRSRPPVRPRPTARTSPPNVSAPTLAEVVARHGLPPQGTPADEAFVIGLPGWPLAERVDGKLDYLPLPTPLHQAVGSYLYDSLRDDSRDRGLDAAVRFTGLPVRIPAYVGNEERLRYPDLAFLKDRRDPRAAADAWNGADLLAEIVSPDDPRRDIEEKRLDYAAAGVPEYWIVDPRPRSRTISVLTLEGGAYRETIYEEGESAASMLLPGFAVDVAGCLGGG